MGKRSNFERRKADAYQTPWAGAKPLIPYLTGIRTFAEPCAGEGRLIRHLQREGLRCSYQGDIKTGQDALDEPFDQYARFDAIITNPPWTRQILHPMIERFMSIAPTWLLFDADWAFTRQAAAYLDHCSTIVPVGRLIWIDDTSDTGKDNCAWYRFHGQHTGGPRLMPMSLEKADHRTREQEAIAA